MEVAKVLRANRTTRARARAAGNRAGTFSHDCSQGQDLVGVTVGQWLTCRSQQS